MTRGGLGVKLRRARPLSLSCRSSCSDAGSVRVVRSGRVRCAHRAALPLRDRLPVRRQRGLVPGEYSGENPAGPFVNVDINLCSKWKSRAKLVKNHTCSSRRTGRCFCAGTRCVHVAGAGADPGERRAAVHPSAAMGFRECVQANTAGVSANTSAPFPTCGDTDSICTVAIGLASVSPVWRLGHRTCEI